MTRLLGRGSLSRFALLLGIVCVLALASSGRAQAPTLPPELEQVRAALEKHHDPYVAVREGYFSTVGCVHFPRPGGSAGRVAYSAGGWASTS